MILLNQVKNLLMGISKEMSSTKIGIFNFFQDFAFALLWYLQIWIKSVDLSNQLIYCL